MIFAVLMVLVLAIIAVGHFVLKLHIPKSKNDSRKSKGSEGMFILSFRQQPSFRQQQQVSIIYIETDAAF